MRELVRKNIGRRLAEYYAQPPNAVVGTSAGTESTRLSSSLGEWHWRRLLDGFYKERQGHWLTPVELFQPHFSHILGDFCLSAVGASMEGNARRLEIVELGGGRGTNARHILSYIQHTRPEIYDGLTYTLVDSSPSLHQLQKDVFADTVHTNRVGFRHMDLMDVAERSLPLLPPSDVATVVIAMEVLDNLPHDKIQAKTRKGLAQAEIRTTPNGGVEETFVPLHDPLLSRVVGTVPSYAKAYPTWVPSVACGVIEHLVHQRPNLGLVVADFDWLPAPDLGIPAETRRTTTWAENEPLITDMKGMDYECFLQAPPYCDILFPTDFDKLRSFTMHTISSRNHRGNVRVEKQADFLERYGSSHVQKTKSWLTGYTPLLQDFVNCSVLTITTASGKVANK